jgi:hypothetical protein
MVGIAKPFRRTCRPGVDGKYPDDTRESYIADQRYACAPEQYVLAFELIQKDLLELFDYIEPAHLNRSVAMPTPCGPAQGPAHSPRRGPWALIAFTLHRNSPLVACWSHCEHIGTQHDR